MSLGFTVFYFRLMGVLLDLSSSLPVQDREGHYRHGRGLGPKSTTKSKKVEDVVHFPSFRDRTSSSLGRKD